MEDMYGSPNRYFRVVLLSLQFDTTYFFYKAVQFLIFSDLFLKKRDNKLLFTVSIELSFRVEYNGALYRK